jgi:hypothetical protein
MKVAAKCAAITIAFAILAQPLAARTRLDCSTTKVIITSAPGGDKSVLIKEDMGFYIDDDTKTFTLSDGTPLRVSRFDASGISAEHNDIQYEFNRSDGSLTYAGSTTAGSTTTTIIGSGQCKAAATRTPN